MHNEYDGVNRTYREMKKLWYSENLGRGDVVHSTHIIKTALSTKPNTLIDI